MPTEKFKKLQWTLGIKTRILKTYLKKIKVLKVFFHLKKLIRFLNLNTILRILIIFLKKLTNDAKKKLYEGKAKVIYRGKEPNTLIQYFKDDATAFNNKKSSDSRKRSY